MLNELLTEIKYQYSAYLADREESKAAQLIDKLEHASSRSAKANLAVSTVVLRLLLQNNPRWFKGHYLLGRKALQTKAVALAFSSGQALLLLAKSSKQRAMAYQIIGASYMCKFEHSMALEQFKFGLDHDPDNFLLMEYLAACYMAMDQEAEAVKILDQIPEGYKSGEVVVVQNYLKSTG